MLGSFPSLSETFVLNQITGLIDRGHSVSIFAERRSSDVETHPDVEHYGLRRLTRYEELPDRFRERLTRLPRAFRGDASLWRGLLDSGRRVLAGVLLIVPGILSDAIALLLLLFPINQRDDPQTVAAGRSSYRDRRALDGDYRRLD